MLTLVKAVRNGVVYGSKVRFPHALVYGTTAPHRILLIHASQTFG